MSFPAKGSVIVADGTGKVTVITPTSDNQVLSLDSTDPKGAKFINVNNLVPKQAQKATASNNNYTSSNTYEVIITLTVPGESVNPVENIKLLSYKDNGITSYDIRIYDATNNQIISETNFSNNLLEINTISNLSNLPSTESIIEIQTKKNGGNNSKNVHILEATIQFAN